MKLEVTTPGKLDIDILSNNYDLIKDRFLKTLIKLSTDDEKKKFCPDMFEKYFAKANVLAKELLKKIEANKKAKSKNK